MADNAHDHASGLPHVVIIGGGIAGLSAAFYLRDEPVRVTVLEAESRVGGKLLMSDVAGVPVDAGAEGLYVRRPKTTKTIAAAGLGDTLVRAGTMSTAMWTRRQMRPLPSRQFMGVPTDMDDLAKSGVLSGEGVARARQDLEMPAHSRNGDVSVAKYIAARQGQEVVDRLVDPFFFDACAGRAEELSFEAMMGPLVMASRKHDTLTAAADSLIPPPTPPGEQAPPPGLGTVTGRLGALPEVFTKAVLASSQGAAIRTGTTVTELARTESGWRLTVDSAAGQETITADAVIVAIPAGPASKLLAGAPGADDATAGLAEIPYASTVIITLAYPTDAFPGGLAARGLSGYRVPAVDGRVVKAVTFSTVKWPHMAGEVDIVRCQAGEDGLRRDDTDLVSVAAAELAEATGVTGKPVGALVSRWANSLPQYTVGHVDRVARIRAAVAAQPGLAVCGAAYDGVGVGTCMANAQKAVDRVLAGLR